MSAPTQSVCTAWAGVEDLCSPCLENIDSYDAGVVGDALLAASDVLFYLTRSRWPGWCEDTVRPCAQYATPDTRRNYSTLGVYGTSAGWTPLGGLGCSCRDVHACGCSHISQIELGEVPITGIVEVLIDGQIVDAARYRVDDYRWLVWQPDESGVDTRRGWPCCQRMDLPTTEEGTFEVTYTVGTPPSRAGVRMAAMLACQFIIAWSPDSAGACKLPKRVTSLSRQQVTMALGVTLFQDGLTGVDEVDLWVQSVLAGDRNRASVVVVPERRRQQIRRAGT